MRSLEEDYLVIKFLKSTCLFKKSIHLLIYNFTEKSRLLSVIQKTLFICLLPSKMRNIFPAYLRVVSNVHSYDVTWFKLVQTYR